MRHTLVQGFKEGFQVGYEGPVVYSPTPNLPSAMLQPEIVDQKLDKECKLGRLAGPFSFIPFQNLKISPIGLVPKKQSGKFRLIHHLSHPPGASINDGISEEHSKVIYQSIDDAVKIINELGQGCFLAKTDVAEAFRIVPLHPSQYTLFGMKWKDKYYFDRCLPMGCSSSCKIFETLSNALQWMARAKLGISHIAHVLDDFLIANQRQEGCDNDLTKFLALCANLGIPTAPDKTTQPTKSLTFLGYDLDTQNMEIRLPDEKLVKGRKLIQECLQKTKVQLKFLQSVIGFLNFACGAVVPGRPFLRRLINLTIGIDKPFHYIRIDKAGRQDLITWDTFLSNFNGRSMLLADRWVLSDHIQLYTDAAGSLGYGAVMGKQWFFGGWNEQWRGQSITLLELYPIVLAIEVWAKELANSCIEFHTDNMAVSEIINKQTSRQVEIMALVRRLVFTSLKYNIMFKAYHVPGKYNVLADALSRLQVETFKKLAPHAEPRATLIPELPVLPL